MVAGTVVADVDEVGARGGVGITVIVMDSVLVPAVVAGVTSIETVWPVRKDAVPCGGAATTCPLGV